LSHHKWEISKTTLRVSEFETQDRKALGSSSDDSNNRTPDALLRTRTYWHKSIAESTLPPPYQSGLIVKKRLCRSAGRTKGVRRYTSILSSATCGQKERNRMMTAVHAHRPFISSSFSTYALNQNTQLQPRDGHVHSLSQSSSLHFNTTFIFTSNDQDGLYAMMQQPTPLHRHSQTGKQPRADPSRSVTVLGHWRRL
jgi:hypothetical protein